ncbi:kinase-like protein [Rhizopogon salebrosus TDB-379]|nr:kinase-like protein [Rhizopogon salebrosus TDB-379]
MSQREDQASARSWVQAVLGFLQLPLPGLWQSQAGYPAGRPTKDYDGILTGQIAGKGPYPTAYGGYCDVWKCSWIKNPGPVEVAVKSIRVPGNDKHREGRSKRLSTAVELWLRLDHDNVMPIFGMTLGFGPLPAVVCPWMKNGTLTSYLEHNHDQMTAQARKDMLLQVISGLRYLHNRSVIHGSLSGSNIFINDLGRACIADFGLAGLLMEFSSETYFSSSIGGAVRWIGPELFQLPDKSGDSVGFSSTQGDIYSFGCIILQVLSGKIPYHYFQRDTQVFFAISTGVKPVRPDTSCINDAQWDVVQQCWLSPEQRPTVEVLHSYIKDLDV